MKNYIIVKKNGKYHLIDTFKEEMDEEYFVNIKLYNGNKVFKKYKYKELVDYYLDIGPIYNEVNEKEYLGILIYESDDIEKISVEFAKYVLTRYKKIERK